MLKKNPDCSLNLPQCLKANQMFSGRLIILKTFELRLLNLWTHFHKNSSFYFIALLLPAVNGQFTLSIKQIKYLGNFLFILQ